MEKLRDFFECLTIILFIQFLSWGCAMFICLFITSVDTPLWFDFVVLLLALTTILSAYITISLCKDKENTERIKENEYCGICNSFLHNNKYPDDFPKKYKICCNCKNIAYIVYKENHKEICDKIIELKDFIPDINAEVYLNRSEFYLKNKKKFDDLFIFKNSEDD